MGRSGNGIHFFLRESALHGHVKGDQVDFQARIQHQVGTLRVAENVPFRPAIVHPATHDIYRAIGQGLPVLHQGQGQVGQRANGQNCHIGVITGALEQKITAVKSGQYIHIFSQYPGIRDIALVPFPAKRIPAAGRHRHRCSAALLDHVADHLCPPLRPEIHRGYAQQADAFAPEGRRQGQGIIHVSTHIRIDKQLDLFHGPSSHRKFRYSSESITSA